MRPPRGDTTTLAVVGGGASAALLLAQLRRQLGDALPPTVIVERRRRLGPGIAYSTCDPLHRMNVRACQLSVFPDEPSAFVEWARRRDRSVTEESYVQRALYGAYLTDALDRAAAPPVSVRHLRDEITALAPVHDGAILSSPYGRVVRARSVVLAVGLRPATSARIDVDPELRRDGRFVDDPWSTGSLARLRRHGRIVVIGTGLTAVDVIVSLAGPAGPKIVAVSGSGVLPHAHEVVRSSAVVTPVPPRHPTSARGVVRWVRETCAGEPNGWPAAIDRIRFEANPLWRSLPAGERARLLRLTSSVWSRHRHRIAPDVAGLVHARVASGNVELQAGTVRAVRTAPVGAGVEVEVTRPSGGDSGTTARLPADAVVNCAGPPGVRSTDDPLVGQLVARGHAVAEPHGLGLLVDADGRLRDADGSVSPVVSVLGGLRRGTEFESTAVPELRVQAAALSRRLIEELHGEAITA